MNKDVKVYRVSTRTCEVLRRTLQNRSSPSTPRRAPLQKTKTKRYCHDSWQRFQCGELHAGPLVLWLQHLPRGRLARKPPSHMKNLLNNENINDLTIFSLPYFYDTAHGRCSFPATDKELILVHKLSRKTTAHVLYRRITHPTRSDTSMQPYTTPPHARNLARADCTSKSRNEICHFVTILIGKRLSVLSVRRSTFHPRRRQQQSWKADKLQRQVMVCVGHLLHLLTLLYTTAH